MELRTRQIEIIVMTACNDLKPFSEQIEIPYRCERKEYCKYKSNLPGFSICLKYTIMKVDSLDKINGYEERRKN